MKNCFRHIVVLALLWCAMLSGVVAQEVDVEALRAEVEELRERVEEAEAEYHEEVEERPYRPQLWGSMMALFNYSFDTGEERFAVRNAHIGVMGKASKNISYLVHVNYHNLATLTVLETNIRYDYKTFYATVGQQCTLLTTDFDRCGPRGNLFTSRSYSVLFALRYATETELGHLSVGDIGLYTNYVFEWKIPLTLSFGAFNGLGMNRIEWDDNINVVGRVQLGGARGVSGGASLYTGQSPFEQDLSIWSAELRYVTDNLFIETNYQQNRVRSNTDASLRRTHAGLIQSYYVIPTPESKLFDYLTPSVRYDYTVDADYLNMVSERVELQSASRLTALVHFGLKGSRIRSRFSVGYEKVFKAERPTDFADNELFWDRLLVAMTVGF